MCVKHRILIWIMNEIGIFIFLGMTHRINLCDAIGFACNRFGKSDDPAPKIHIIACLCALFSLYAFYSKFAILNTFVLKRTYCRILFCRVYVSVLLFLFRSFDSVATIPVQVEEEEEYLKKKTSKKHTIKTRSMLRHKTDELIRQ